MSTIKCPKCEQPVPKERVEFIKSLWGLMSGYYADKSEKKNKDIEMLEVTVRINGDVVDLINPMAFWQL